MVPISIPANGACVRGIRICQHETGSSNLGKADLGFGMRIGAWWLGMVAGGSHGQERVENSAFMTYQMKNGEES